MGVFYDKEKSTMERSWEKTKQNNETKLIIEKKNTVHKIKRNRSFEDIEKKK